MIARERRDVLAIVRAVAERYHVTAEDLRMSSAAHAAQARRLTAPRSVAMYLVVTDARCSLSATGRFFGRHHTSVLHAVRVVAANHARHEWVREEIGALRAAISSAIGGA